ncbi:MAG: Ig-like domain-containing protein [Gemmatimonadaceae bacterium]
MWTSSANLIATVSQAGVVTGVAVGTATITATSEGKQQTATITITPPPQAVFASIAPGGNHTCALDSTGKAFCWGSNNNGVLGNATSPTNPHTPLPVSGGFTFSAIASGMYHSCAITAVGVAYCWGWNIKGQLGDGTNADRDVPTPVNTALRFTSIAAGGQAGGEHSCALTAAGVAYCWGWNIKGQLGDGTNVDRTTPYLRPGGARAE